MHRDELIDEMVELACKAITERRGFVWPDEFSEDEKQTGRENMRAALSAALEVEQPVAVEAHIYPCRRIREMQRVLESAFWIQIGSTSLAPWALLQSAPAPGLSRQGRRTRCCWPRCKDWTR